MNQSLAIRISQITNPKILSQLETFPNQAVIWGILDGLNKGQIWELSKDQSYLIFEDNEPETFVFIAGLPDLSAVRAALRLCHDHPMTEPVLYCHRSLHPWLLAQGWTFHPRVKFSYLESTTYELSSGRVMKPIKSEDVFRKCLSFKEMSQRYGSLENFLSLGTGYALYQGEQVISEAFIAFQGRNYAEISVITHPDYRHQNAATQVASHLVEDCIKKGLTPIWSCDANNMASLKTALKVGFHIDRYDMQLISEPLNY